MNKHSTFRFALSLLSRDITIIILHWFILVHFFNISDNPFYQWAITILLTFVLYAVVWMTAAQQGKSDVDYDVMNQKRFDNKEALEQKKTYSRYKGFIAGLISKIPALILLILLLTTGSDTFKLLLSLYFGVHYSALVAFGIGVIPILSYIILFSVVSGIAYMTGPAQREKVLTVIKRNEENYKSKKYKDYKADKKY